MPEVEDRDKVDENSENFKDNERRAELPGIDSMERGDKTIEEDKKSDGLDLQNVYSSSQTKDQQRVSQNHTKS